MVVFNCCFQLFIIYILYDTVVDIFQIVVTVHIGFKTVSFSMLKIEKHLFKIMKSLFRAYLNDWIIIFELFMNEDERLTSMMFLSFSS